MIKENLAQISQRIKVAAQRAGRNPDSVRLICVTKSATVEQVEEAISSGVTDIGENRVQDALLKFNQLTESLKKTKCHMIGHLQTNKVKKCLKVFDIIHSLDSLGLAAEIDKRALSLNKRIDCFIEVNTSSEPQKYGIDPKSAEEFIRKAAEFQHIRVIGLMTMAPFVEDKEEARPFFTKLRKLKDKFQALSIPNTDIRELSMGMSQDFEVAVEEGATFVRIGSAIFNSAPKL